MLVDICPKINAVLVVFSFTENVVFSVQFAAFLMLVFMLEAIVGVAAYLYEATVRSF